MEPDVVFVHVAGPVEFAQYGHPDGDGVIQRNEQRCLRCDRLIAFSPGQLFDVGERVAVAAAGPRTRQEVVRRKLRAHERVCEPVPVEIV